jgi:hypothetical protein
VLAEGTSGHNEPYQCWRREHPDITNYISVGGGTIWTQRTISVLRREHPDTTNHINVGGGNTNNYISAGGGNIRTQLTISLLAEGTSGQNEPYYKLEFVFKMYIIHC